MRRGPNGSSDVSATGRVWNTGKTRRGPPRPADRRDRPEGAIAVGTFVVTLALEPDVQYAVLVGIALSIESHPLELVALEGGPFVVGTDEPWLPGDGEGPARPVELRPFRIAQTAVRVDEFEAFVRATGHVTTAERLGWSFVFAGSVDEGANVIGRSSAGHWWVGVAGATWRRPGGRRAASGEGPAVHVSWPDAAAYCAWLGVRLPSEAEWEYAAAAGVPGRPFPWGHELELGGVHRCNVWQGDFPRVDTGADGFAGTAPVDAYEQNGFGLYNAIGNVWEWCADAHGVAASSCCAPAETSSARVQKGGSYLCHASYCARYRIQARLGSGEDTTTGNAGFRVAADA